MNELKADEQKHDVKGRYIKPFLKHCSEIITKREEILRELRKIIAEVKVNDYVITLEESQEKSQENFYLKMVRKNIDDDKFNFMIGVTLDQDNILNFQTAFFESELGV